MRTETLPLHRNCNSIALDLWTLDDDGALQCVIGYATSLCLVMEFVKFDEFDEKLPVHTKWLDEWKTSRIYTYNYYW